jgi:hypothetical protein
VLMALTEEEMEREKGKKVTHVHTKHLWTHAIRPCCHSPSVHLSLLHNIFLRTAPISYRYFYRISYRYCSHKKPFLIRIRSTGALHLPLKSFPKDGFLNSTTLENEFLWMVFLTQPSMKMDCYRHFS